MFTPEGASFQLEPERKWCVPRLKDDLPMKYDQGDTGIQDLLDKGIEIPESSLLLCIRPGYIEGCHFHSIQPLKKWKGRHLDNSLSQWNIFYWLSFSANNMETHLDLQFIYTDVPCTVHCKLSCNVYCKWHDQTSSESQWYMTLHHWNWYTILTKLSPPSA